MVNLNMDMTKDKILPALISFAIPIFISNIFQQLYNTMDTMIVGNFLGDTSLAAIGTCSAVYDLLIGFAIGVGNGLSVVVARYYGAKDEELLKKSVAGAIIIGFLLTFVVMAISKIGLYPLLKLLDTPENIIDESYSYISTITLFVSVMFAYNLCAGLLRALGNSFAPLLFLIIASVINITLDILLIVHFHMGIRGAAIATVIAQGISFVLCAIYIFHKKAILIPKKRHFSYDKELYMELAGQGFSMGFMMMIVSTGTVILQKAINASHYLMINAPFYAVVGTLFILRHSLQGLGKKIVPIISSIIEFSGKILFVWLFIPKSGYTGVMICEPIKWCLMCTVLLYAFINNPYIKKR